MFGTVETPGFAVPTNHQRDMWLDAEPDTYRLTLWGHCHVWQAHICVDMAHSVTVTICLRDRTARTPWTLAKSAQLPRGSDSSGIQHAALPGGSWLQVPSWAHRPLMNMKAQAKEQEVHAQSQHQGCGRGNVPRSFGQCCPHSQKHRL